MEARFSFGAWLRRRRRALDLTQAELAQRVGCVPGTIKSIEAETRRPSKQLAARLADVLGLEATEHALFLKVARAELSAGRLPPPARVGHTPDDQAPHVPPAGDQAALPTGMLTFLFTDLEGSTQLWEQHPQGMHVALARHDTILKQAISAKAGKVFKTTGDGVLAVFPSAVDALSAAIVAQRALQQQDWGVIGPLRVRMALHTAVGQVRDGDYFGPPLNRVARLCAVAYGGQILLSGATKELVQDRLPPTAALLDLGEHRLKDLTLPEHIFQLVAPELGADFPPLKIVEHRSNNLPAQATRLIGRERELATVCALLRRNDVRLVSLTGTGGVGKTRLSLQIAADLLDEFANGVFFVALAPISDPSLVVSAIANTLGVREAGDQNLIASLKDYLREKQLLLVLDNFEQILAAALDIGEILTAARQLKVLVTSREALGLYGEYEFAVQPLSVPDLTHPQSMALLTKYDCVRLFIERSQAVNANYVVTEENARAIAEICCRLDGLPLAIELAAARSKMFPAEALLKRLDSRLGLLTKGPRDMPNRHQTLRAAIEWSYDLLDDFEKQLFTRLSVFVGGFVPDAAEIVCNEGSDLQLRTIDGLESLFNKSLLDRREGGRSELGFVILETIREYATERLVESGAADTIRRRHAAYYLELAEAAEPMLTSGERGEWLTRLAVEHDNLRAALAWSAAEEGRGEIGGRLVGALGWFWYFSGHLSEARYWLDSMLKQHTRLPTAIRAKMLFAAGAQAFYHGDYTKAHTLLEESVMLWQELGDIRGLAYAECTLGRVSLFEGDLARALSYAEKSVALSRDLGDKWAIGVALNLAGNVLWRHGNQEAARNRLEESLAAFRAVEDSWGLALSLGDLGQLVEKQGDYDAAWTLLRESLLLLRTVGDKWLIARALINLGQVAIRRNDFHEVTMLLTESSALWQELGDRRAIAQLLERFARLAVAQGQPAWALRLCAVAEAIRQDIGVPLPPSERARYEDTLARARATLDASAFSVAFAEGSTMTPEQALAAPRDALKSEAGDLRSPTPTSPPPSRPAGLTAREMEVLQLLAQGLTYAEIAKQLVVSPRTVNRHLSSIYDKLGVNSRSAAMRFAIDQGLA
jgi:predicted ATPase/class 3 adenylate cyclase/DNA-binding CsgD family transcriptional regulator